MLNLRAALEQAVTAILREPEKIDSPVLRFLFEREVDHLKKQEAPLGFDLYKNILAEMSALKKDFAAQADQFTALLKSVTDRGAEKSGAIEAESALASFEGA